MAHAKHGVNATSDPNFKPDPDAHHVFDEKKGVYRLVVKPAKKVNAKRKT